MSRDSLSDWISYNFAVLRLVPHVHIGAFVPVGIVLHARTTEFIGARVITDRDELAARAGDADVELLSLYLESCAAICAVIRSPCSWIKSFHDCFGI